MFAYNNKTKKWQLRVTYFQCHIITLLPCAYKNCKFLATH